jgi:hypothetical protein
MLISCLFKVGYYADVSRFVDANFQEDGKFEALGDLNCFLKWMLIQGKPLAYSIEKVLLTLCKKVHSDEE